MQIIYQQTPEEKRLKEILKEKTPFSEIVFYVDNYQSVKNWLLSVSSATLTKLDKKSSTVRHYVRYLIKFCKLVGNDPDSIIRDKYKKKKDDDPFTSKKYETFVFTLSEAYKSQDKRTAARESAVALKSFFTSNGTPLVNVKAPPKSQKYEKSRLTIEEIKRILQYCDMRSRAIILITLQSGIRPETLLLLTYGDLKEDLENNVFPIKIYIPITKVKGNYAPYTALLGTDACMAIVEYLNYRRARGEEITDNSPLIAKLSKGEPIKYGELRKTFVALMPVLPILKINKRVTMYTLRRSYQTIMEKYMPINWVDRLMGHIKFRGIQGEAYSTPTVEDLIEGYTKAEPNISVSQISDNKKMVQYDILKNLARMLDVDIDDLLKKQGRASFDDMTDDQLLSIHEAFRGALRQLTSPAETVDDTKHTHSTNISDDSQVTSAKVIIAKNEDELIYFSEIGYTLIKELTNHRFLMSRDKSQ